LEKFLKHQVLHQKRDSNGLNLFLGEALAKSGKSSFCLYFYGYRFGLCPEYFSKLLKKYDYIYTFVPIRELGVMPKASGDKIVNF
jgi:hypothetical protein